MTKPKSSAQWSISPTWIEKRDERSFDGMDGIEQSPGQGVRRRNFNTRHAG